MSLQTDAAAIVEPFTPDVFQARRERLMHSMETGLAAVYAADASGTAGINSDFTYLTGMYGEPKAILLLAPGERTFREFLFLEPRDPDSERWFGERLPLGSSLEELSGVRRVRRLTALGWTLTQLITRVEKLHFLGPVTAHDAPIPTALDLYGKLCARMPSLKILNSTHLIRDMRGVKDEAELSLIRAAVGITEKGLLAALRTARAGMAENELRAVIEAEIRAAGGQGTAFPTIVGAGPNAAVIHYHGGNRRLEEGELVLCDVGAMHNRYCGDLTRTFPVGGVFRARHRHLYELVLNAQEAALKRAKAGAYHDDLQAAAEEVLAPSGMSDYFRHTIGHFLGLEVHDVGNYAQPLREGAVLTVEPGLYTREESTGIRIEDDVLITSDGYVRLSGSLPRTPDEIEQVMRGD